MTDQQKSELLKGLLECLPEERKGIEFKGGSIKCLTPNDCTFPNCNCDEPEPYKTRYRTREEKGYNQALSEVRTALEGWVKGLEFDTKAIAFAIRDADFPFMKCIAKERRDEACYDIAKALASKGSLLIKVRGEK